MFHRMMQVITKYRWQLLVFLTRLLVQKTEAQKQGHEDLTQNKFVDSQNHAIPKTFNTSLTESSLHPSLMKGNGNLHPSSMKGNKALSYLY